MNDLTLFLYAVELAGRLPTVTVLLAVTIVALGFFLPPKGVIAFSYDHEGPFMGFGRIKPLIYIWSVVATVTFLVPSKETLYLMAGSEVVEFAVSTPEAQEFMKDVKEVIDIQLEKLKQ